MQNDELAEALADPGKLIGFRLSDESLSQWQARAVRAYANREDVVERMARAIAASKRGIDPAAGVIDMVFYWYIGQARAAINAMLGGGDAE